MKLLQRVYAMLAFCSILTFPSFTNAQAVQICDMSAHHLYDRSNVILTRTTPLSCSDVAHLGKLSPESPYDLYTFVVKPRERVSDGAVVSFFNNGAGCVSKITIMSDHPDSSGDQGYIIFSVLLAMGLSFDEIDTLIKGAYLLSSDNVYSDVWGTKLNRRIIMEFRIDTIENGVRMGVTRLTATDN